MNTETIEIRIKGRGVSVPSVNINDRIVVCRGKWPRIASVASESLVEGETVPNPDKFIADLLESDLHADIFTFAEKLPHTVPRYRYHLEWGNIAAIPITSWSEWLAHRVAHDVRSAVKKAARVGVAVKVAEFNDQFVEGIKRIYDETPIRQGKHFWHYHKDTQQIKKETSTYAERSMFLGAYYADQLIGFVKLVLVGKTEAVILQAVSEKQHSSKKPTNALIAKAVEICEQKGVAYLTYGSYSYGDEDNSLTEFKRRNGFEKILLPRYHIPLTVGGTIALGLNLHRRLVDWCPRPVLAHLRRVRSALYSHKGFAFLQSH